MQSPVSILAFYYIQLTCLNIFFFFSDALILLMNFFLFYLIDAVLKSYKNVTKAEAMQLIGTIIKHSSERLKRKSSNIN